MQKRSKILIAAGGSGGHLLPAQQLGRLLQEKEGASVTFAGYKLHISPYFDKKQFPFFEISSASKLFNIWGLIKGFFQAVQMLRKVKPDVVVGFGSYHSAPVLLAAVLLRKKIVLYEANRQIGKVNRLFSLFAVRIGFQFPLIDFQSSKLIPVRRLPWIQGASKTCSRTDYGLEEDCFTVLVFGGSQGAKFLNETAPKALKNCQVIHLAGSEGGAALAAEGYKKSGIRAVVKAFESEMEKVYSIADFALCRSGAGTVAELIRFGVPSLLIPYPYAGNHQRYNAEYLVDLGGACFLVQEEATASAIAKKIETADKVAMRFALQKAKNLDETSVELTQLVGQICKNTIL